MQENVQFLMQCLNFQDASDAQVVSRTGSSFFGNIVAIDG